MNPPPAVDDQGPGFIESSRFSAWSAPAAERLPFPRELLHSIVATFHDVHIAAPVEGQVGRIGQLPRFAARLAPTANELSAASKDLDPVIRAVDGVKKA